MTKTIPNNDKRQALLLNRHMMVNAFLLVGMIMMGLGKKGGLLKISTQYFLFLVISICVVQCIFYMMIAVNFKIFGKTALF